MLQFSSIIWNIHVGTRKLLKKGKKKTHMHGAVIVEETAKTEKIQGIIFILFT